MLHQVLVQLGSLRHPPSWRCSFLQGKQEEDETGDAWHAPGMWPPGGAASAVGLCWRVVPILSRHRRQPWHRVLAGVCCRIAVVTHRWALVATLIAGPCRRAAPQRCTSKISVCVGGTPWVKATQLGRCTSPASPRLLPEAPAEWFAAQQGCGEAVIFNQISQCTQTQLCGLFSVSSGQSLCYLFLC